MAKFIVGLILIASIILWSSPGQADLACKPLPTGNKWAAMPIEYEIDPNVPNPLLVRTALEAWTSKRLFFREVSTSPNRFRAGTMPPDFVDSIFVYFNPNGTIRSFLIAINFTSLENLGIDPTPAIMRAIGRVIGIDFTDCPDSIMRRGFMPFVTAPSTADLAVRDRLYPPYSVYFPLLMK